MSSRPYLNTEAKIYHCDCTFNKLNLASYHRQNYFTSINGVGKYSYLYYRLVLKYFVDEKFLIRL